MPKTKKFRQSSVTGKIVTKEFVRKNPKTTFVQLVPIKKRSTR